MFNFLNAKKIFDSSLHKKDIVAPVTGQLFPISSVPDAIFSKKVLGDGVAFKGDDEIITVYAPANGELSLLYPTGHAFGITMNNGIEILIHIGINTVETNGEGFEILDKKQGDKVRALDPIVNVNIGNLKQRYDMSIMLIITNHKNYDIKFIDSCNVIKGQNLLKE